MTIYNYKNKSLNKRKAFTLVELLIVIAIIGILFIVLVSKMDFASDKAKMTGVQTDFRSFQVALETVAREHDGFNTFGWDYGDINGDRIRNSYDEGDLNINDKKDENEVWTGHKVPGEEWTGIYTLKNPANPDDKSAIGALQDAINANLDPKLHITIHDDYTITMANSAKDPWKTEYHGRYLSNAVNDSGDRGAIIIYSNGSNQEFGSEEKIENGRVTVSVPGNNVYGQDDMSISTVYSYNNGYGEVNTTTSGFSQNQKVDIVGSGNMGDGVDTPFIPAESTETRSGGLYKTGTNTMLYSWDELVSLGIITADGRGAGADKTKGPDQSTIDFLSGDLQVPNTITKIPDYAFYGCKNLTGIVLTSGTTSVGKYAFSYTGINFMVVHGPVNLGQSFTNTTVKNIYYNNVDSLLKSSVSTPGNDHHYMSPVGENTNIYIKDELLEHLVVPDGYTSVGNAVLYYYKKLQTVTLPETVTKIGWSSFVGCSNLSSINLENVTYIGKYAFKGTNLSEVNLPKIETMYAEAFKNCASLTKATIGSSITRFDFDTFGGCNEKLELFYEGNLEMWVTALNKPDQYNKIGITGGGSYRLFFEGSEVAGVFEVPQHWNTVYANVFSGVSGLTGVKLHSNVTSIGEYSFYNSGIINIDFNQSISEIGAYAFYSNPLESLDLPDCVTTLGTYSFAYCRQMKYVNINETSLLTDIGNGVFAYCKEIESLYIPPLIKRLDAHSLVLYCNKLKELTFSPNTQLEYLNVSFGYVDFVTVYLPDTVKVVKDLDISVNSNSALVVGENSQLERMEGKMFDRYSGDLYIPKNLNYISEDWTDFQFSPKVKIHPENQYFKYENGCLIDINNKRIIASNGGAVVPTDGSVTSIGKNAGYGGIRYIPKVITKISGSAWDNSFALYFDLVYEGTMEEWIAITGIKIGSTCVSNVSTVTCSDGVLNGNGKQINP